MNKKQQKRGLMFRKKLDKNKGMIFTYSKPRIMHFWMRNTHIPLSIAFVDQDNIITKIYKMKPYSEKIVSSITKVLYAIEANQNWFNNNFIFAGSKIKIIPY